MGQRIACVFPAVGWRNKKLIAFASETVTILTDAGWDITSIQLQQPLTFSAPYGIDLDTKVFDQHPLYFSYISQLAAAQQLDLSEFDAVMTVGAPTYAVNHKRKIAFAPGLQQAFYGLADYFVESRFVDKQAHQLACEAIAMFETAAAATVTQWIATSSHEAALLQQNLGIPDKKIAICNLPATSAPKQAPWHRPNGPISCFALHEWGGRSEVVLQTAHSLRSKRPTVFVGNGSRLDFIKNINNHFLSGASWTKQSWGKRLWLNQGNVEEGQDTRSRKSHIKFYSDDDPKRINEIIDSSAVVILPEIGASFSHIADVMIRAKPVIVCSDGGAISEMIVNNHNGIIAEPEPESILRALEKITRDPSFASRLGEAARRTALELSHQTLLDFCELSFRDIFKNLE